MGRTDPATTDRGANPGKARLRRHQVSILGDNRDHRFHAGLGAVLAGTVPSPRDTDHQRWRTLIRWPID